ncbi:MAG TPA: 3-phosphoshikimate 1-carboxyvinyltransferase [Capsulimonadaceae bacterium]|nr:3-phosphoshikimate 1-carboxyvinyltransferase [Capsulimonadaceae bacterium]
MDRYPTTISFTPVTRPVSASVRVPGSKSITNRALLLAALAEGESRLLSPLDSDDTERMQECLRLLGVSVSEQDGGDLVVQGASGRFQAPEAPLMTGNSGTTIRFLTAAAALVPAGAEVVLDGAARMRERPIKDLLDALAPLGVKTHSLAGNGCPPVTVAGGGLPGGHCTVHGGISSQYLSALLLAAPLAQNDVTIQVEGNLVSKPYVDITQSVIAAFGGRMENDAYCLFRAPARQKYQGRVYAVEPDASNAAYFLAAAAVAGGRVVIEGLGTASVQGDARFVDVLEQMGCTVERAPQQLIVAGPEKLKGIDIDLETIPDTAQTAAVLAAFAEGPSTITGIGNLRVKETDRIAAIAIELRKLGADVEEGRDYWRITPAKSGLHGAAIDTYDDHRMAMSFAVAGLRVPGLTINDPGCVAKTFPDFWILWEEAFGNVRGI